jgi:hypothetical protein
MSVEFKLFGELTLKQFLYVGGAGAISYMILASGMVLPLKLFLSLIIAGSGAALALIPVNNRPLEVWVGNFVQAMINPTKRVWKKGENPNIPKTVYSMEEYNKQVNIPVAQSPMTSPPGSVNANIMPSVGLNSVQSIPVFKSATPEPIPIVPSPVAAQPAAVPTVLVPQNDKISTEQAILNPSTTNTPVVNIPATAPNNLVTPPPAPASQEISLLSQPNNTKIDAEMTPQTPTQNLTSAVAPDTAAKPAAPGAREVLVLDIQKLSEHGVTLPGYTPKPNVIKGIVKDSQGSLIAAAIVIIKRKENNQPARAMVTNPLGEFETTTPLDNGTYIVDISHDNKEMPFYELTLDSTPVPPLQFQFTA